MRLVINNIGKIKNADIILDGITVICGNNDSGKSTVGKVLFSFFNSCNNIVGRVRNQKFNKMKDILKKNVYARRLTGKVPFGEMISTAKSDMSGNEKAEHIKRLLNTCYDIDITDDDVIYEIIDFLNTPDKEIEGELIYRFFDRIFNSQIKTAEECIGSGDATLVFKNGSNRITFYDKMCESNIETEIYHCAYYIDNPFVLDQLSTLVHSEFGYQFSNTLSSNVINAIMRSKIRFGSDDDTDVIESVNNKHLLESVMKILEQAYKGKTEFKNGSYFYSEGGRSVDFRNLSTGLKSFALIERLLECGCLKKKDVLIFDEPEIHLHPEWQLVYAELLVVLQKTFDLTVLINTHSMIFLQALDLYCKKYENKTANYYLSDTENNSFKHIESEDISEIYSQTNKVINHILDEEYELGD